jgi:hypothetical protein
MVDVPMVLEVIYEAVVNPIQFLVVQSFFLESIGEKITVRIKKLRAVFFPVFRCSLNAGTNRSVGPPKMFNHGVGVLVPRKRT